MSARIEAVLTCDRCGATYRKSGTATVGAIRRSAKTKGWTLRWKENRCRADWCDSCSTPAPPPRRPTWSNHHTFALADLMAEVDGVLWQDSFGWQVLEFVTGNGTRGSVHLDKRGRFSLGSMGGTYWAADHRSHAYTSTPRQLLDSFSAAVRAANER